MKIPDYKFDLQNLQFIFMPNYWLMNYSYSKKWDDELNRLMDANKFHNISRYTAYLGGVEIWIENHPYASFQNFTNFTSGDGDRVRPSRLTILRAKRKLDAETR